LEKYKLQSFENRDGIWAQRQEVREGCGKSNNEKRHNLYSSAKYGMIKPMRMRLAGDVMYVSQNRNSDSV
jgi:hypothetical protein